MTKIFYLPLEAYSARYTLQLQGWMESRMAARGVPFQTIAGTPLRDDQAIKTGRVLDAHGRCHWALTQMAELVRLLHDGHITAEDVIYFEDLFHPGYEALPYIFDQSSERSPRVFTRCFAQTIDPDDFTQSMMRWMRQFELMVDRTISGIMIASTEMAPLMRICGMAAPLFMTGLPFDRDEVRSRVPIIKPLVHRRKRVVWASRWDEEKQPGFFMDLIEQSDFVARGYEFAVLTGLDKLRSNDQALTDRAEDLRKRGLLVIHEGLRKDAYYALLADSQVQFNSARQDWVSNTLNEASALGTLSLCPAFRSFPEALNNDPRHLYVPWSLSDAIGKLDYLLTTLDDRNVGYAADAQHRTLDHVIDVLLGEGDHFLYTR